MLSFNSRGIRHVEELLLHSKRLAHTLAAGSSFQTEWIENVETQRSSTLINVTWSSGKSNRYPLVYLRENCLCPSCFHGPSRQRAIDPIEDVDVNSVAQAVHVNEKGRTISIKWYDDHISEFDSDWLFLRRLPSRKFESSTNELASRDVEAWDTSFTGNIPEYSFEKIFADHEIEFNWLKSMSRLGVVILNDVPMKPGQIERLANHLGYIKQTVFGKTFQVRSKMNVSTLAYTSRGLTPHTDIPPLEQRPGVQLLHCIKQFKGSGGVNTIVDGLNVAQKLKRADLAAFGLLTTKHVIFSYHGNEDAFGEFMIKYMRPVIELDSNGKLVRLSISDRSRQEVLDADAEELHEWYHAYFKLIKMLRARENTVNHKLQPGELLVMDNDRLAHGRTAFSGDGEGDRWLEGGYVDWDLLHSRLRVLSKKLNKPNTDAP